MAYDYKRLCNELLNHLYQCDWPDGEQFYALVERTQAALAEPDPMNDLRQASADVSGVELHPCWWQKAARKKLKEKAQAIFDAYCTLADLHNRSVSESEMLAAALRETINQCQDSQGMISAPELLRIATQLDVAEDDIDLFQVQ
jgi:hypothetical protein